MLHFIIYGAGYRGRRLFAYFPPGTVVAFIDADAAKVGTMYCGVPVITLRQYVSDYKRYHIISSPSDTRGIERALKKEGIYNWSALHELPSEFQGYGRLQLNEAYRGLIHKYDGKCFVYGMTAFSLWLHRALREVGNHVVFVKPPSIARKRLEEIANCNGLEVGNPPFGGGVVFQTIREKKEILHDVVKGNHFVDAYDYPNASEFYFNHELAKLKDKFRAQGRCFIVATGASLTVRDLEKLKAGGEFCISMNTIFKLKDIAWRPDIYVVTDSFLMNREREAIANYDVKLKLLGDSSDFVQDMEKNILLMHIASTGLYPIQPPFSENVAQTVYAGSTVTYACLQVAVYLGFPCIYLLGVDHGYRMGSRDNHVAPDQEEDNVAHHLDSMELAYRKAREYAEEHGIKIYNATRGGNLEVFERVDFDSLF